jgi:hypothetical protein
MAHSDPAAAAAATPQHLAQDTQTLIALLGNLMPLLLQFQPQGAEQLYRSGQGSFGHGGFQAQNPTPAHNPIIDHQAATSLAEHITADSLRTLSTYLEAHAGQHAGLESCIAIVTRAARCFAARDYAQAFSLIWQAYQLITMLRAANPQIPPLRGSDPTAASPSSPNTQIH